MKTRYVISPTAVFRIRESQVEASLGPATLSLSRNLYTAILSFAEPQTLQAAHRALGMPVTLAQFSSALQPLIKHGFLKPEKSQAERGECLDTYWNPRVWNERGLARRVRQHLRAGEACVIQDAFRPDFANRMAAELSRITRWPSDELFSPFFGYKEHVLTDPASFPKGLRAMEKVFGSTETKQMAERLCGANCRGPIQFSAAMYSPGDYSLPHYDNSLGRSLTFLWYLTRRWDPSWGGQLFWCATEQFLMPSFNTLLLFRANHQSQHFVCPVSHDATEKRLTIIGWWTSSEGPTALSDVELRERRQGDWYFGSPMKRISRHAFVLS